MTSIQQFSGRGKSPKDLMGLNSEEVNTILNTPCLIIRDLGFDLANIDRCKEQYLAFCKQLGTPIPHNHDPNSLVWDIRAVKNSNSIYQTHSELSAEADLHTDSAFSDNPEDYFCLLVLRKAMCNGGASILLSAEQFVSELRKEEKGARTEEILRTKPFPFSVPSIFAKNAEGRPEYSTGLILKDEHIRFRSDSIENATQTFPSSIDAEQREAFAVAKRILADTPLTETLMLEPGEVIIIDNKKILHGRQSFEDENRHLLRIRLRNT